MKKRTMVLPTVAMLYLLGCTEHNEVDRNSQVRNAYRSREECMKDWNKTPQDCQQDPTTHFYMSPWFPYFMYMQGYNSGMYRNSMGVMSQATGSFHSASSLSANGGKVSISRGGFGSTGHSGGSVGE